MELHDFLNRVSSKKLDKPLWLKRNSRCEVFSSIIFKGDVSSSIWFERSHALHVVECIVQSVIWLPLLFLAFSAVRSIIAQEIDPIIHPLVPATWSVKLAGGYLGGLIAFYWQKVNRFSSQWTYCAGVFNKIFYDKFPLANGEPAENHLYRKVTYAIDLLDCNLWAHSSFWADFNYALECAIIFKQGSSCEAAIPIENAKLGLMTRNEARNYLSNFQNSLELNLQSSAHLTQK